MTNLLQRIEVRALLALVLLLVVGGIMAPTTIALSALGGLVPFAGILAVAAVGQHVVIAQRGLDISVAGIFSLAAVLVTALQTGSGTSTEAFSLLGTALITGALFGLINGLTVTRLGVPPLVVTIAVNSIAFGIVLQVSGGTARSVAPAIGDFSLGSTFGIPNPFVIALIIVGLVAYVLNYTTLGRRFQVAGLNPVTGAALGFQVERFQIGAYVAAAVLFSVAGVMFAGLSDVPTLFAGNDYMLASVAAFIVGGNSITGERGSVLATGIGAFFLTYLGQLVISLGFDTSVQFMIQAVIVLLGVSIPSLTQRLKAA